MTKTTHLVLIGAGNRGAGIFGAYALEMPHLAKFVAVVEPDDNKREAFALRHKIPATHCFSSASELFQNPPSGIDGVVIATREDQRIEPLFRCMEHNWNILVEKPLCTNLRDLFRIHDAALSYGPILIVCHQLRLTPVYRTIKRLIDSGDYGEIVCIQHSENLDWTHMAHSFVRGYFNNDQLSPILLAKSCHDLDLLVHLVNRPAEKVASFGSLNYFRPENAPQNAPDFCLDGCAHRHACPYDVSKVYFSPRTDPAYLRQMGVIESSEQLRELLRTNRFGRCVFRCDNNVVDNQVVQISFAGGIQASFTMCGHNGRERRMTKISLTNGEIEFDGRGSDIRATRFVPYEDSITTAHSVGTHGGGDRAIMENFVDAILTNDQNRLLTPIRRSFEGHFLVFAAEYARKQRQVIDLADFESQLRVR